MKRNWMLFLCAFVWLNGSVGCGDDGSNSDADTDADTDTDTDADTDADTDTDTDADTDTEVAIDPAADCDLPRELLVGSCMVETSTCYEYYVENTPGSLAETCANGYNGTWSDGPCTTHPDLVLVGICRLESESLGHLYESRWNYTPEFIPGYVSQLHNTMANSCETLSSDPDAWCSVEDGTNVVADCSREVAGGICNMQSIMPQCVEYGSAGTAETACASIEGGFAADANCPAENLVGWCNNVETSVDIFYYDVEVTQATIDSCNGMGAWCTP